MEDIPIDFVTNNNVVCDPLQSNDGTGHASVHIGVICDKCGMSPIIGTLSVMIYT